MKTSGGDPVSSAWPFKVLGVRDLYRRGAATDTRPLPREAVMRYRWERLQDRLFDIKRWLRIDRGGIAW